MVSFIVCASQLNCLERPRIAPLLACLGLHKQPHIQGDSRGFFNTLGNDSMCHAKQKSSYEYGSDFERLRNYERLKLRIEGNDY